MKFKAPGRTKKNKSKSNEEAVAAALAEPAPEEVSPPAEESEEVEQDAVPAETSMEEELEAVPDQGGVGDTIIEESEGQISVTEASSEDRGLKIDIPKMFLSPFCGFYLFHRL